MKILIVKLGAIGDVIMSLTMLTEIERLYPGAHVTWVCGRAVEPLLRSFPQIDELVPIDDKLLLTGSKVAKLGVVLGFWHKLLGRAFDLAVIGHGDPAYKLLIKPVKSGKVRAFTRDVSLRNWPVMGRHHCDEYARLIAANDDYAMRTGIFPNVDHLKAPIEKSGLIPIVALSPGGASTSRTELELRRWPIAQYATLAEKLIAAGYRVVVTGGPDDGWCRSSFANLGTVDMIGKTSVVELISLLSTCDLVRQPRQRANAYGIAG